MKRKRFSVEQIVAVLKQAEMGPPLRTSSATSGLLSRRSTCGSESM